MVRSNIWGGVRARLAGTTAAVVWILAACGGGGGGDEQPDFAVAVKVDGVADASNPLTAGEATTIDVASGSQLSFDSEGETRWLPTATDSTYDVGAFSFTSKSLSVTSNAGGRLVIVFSDKADASKKATLTVNVAPHRFERVAPVDGEILEWKYTMQPEGGAAEVSTSRRRTVLTGADGSYRVESGPVATPATYTNSNLFDAQDRSLGSQNLTADYRCANSVPVVWYDYPLYVGKTWTGQYNRECFVDGASIGSQTTNFVRTVEAFERVTVPAGTYNTLRVRYERTHVDSSPQPPRICWWAVNIGREVKCEASFHYPDSPTEHWTEVVTGHTR